MAPATNSAKALQQNRTRPVVSRPVMPAIPLSYGQKRSNKVTARPKVKEVEEESQTLVSTSVEEPSVPTPPPTNATPDVVNGSSDTKSEKAEEVKQPESPGRTQEEAVVEVATEAPILESDAAPDGKEPQTSTPSEAPSVSSKSTYQMPPPFVPANRKTNDSPAPSTRHKLQNAASIDSASFPPSHALNGHHAFHHGHPSTSSLVFGGYPDSNNSSPAPPLSASHYPPPPFPPNGHHPHPSIHHAPHLSNGGFPHNASNGFSPMAPPPGYYPHMNGPVDYSRRQVIPYTVDGYSPVHTPHSADPRAYDPSTPHSFQGSQSSALAGDNDNLPANYTQYPVVNGTNGQIDNGRAYAPPRAKRVIPQPPMNFPVHEPGPRTHLADHLDGLVPYLHSQFNNPELSDCTLELRYTDDRDRPAMIPGHRLILARSSTLKDIMAKQPQNSEYGQTLLVESRSPSMRSDAFAMAVQRLYGWPLIDDSVLAAINPQPGGYVAEKDVPGSLEDRFSLGLGYATAGYLLQVPPVISRGLEIASHYINWNTIEKALDFQFETDVNSQDPNSHDQPSVVPPAVLNLLHHPATTFVITSFPADFKLDTSVTTSTLKSRLPVIPDERPINHSHRLSFIRFGEYGSEESERASSSEFSTLSKILLNLPFPALKYVLESSRLGNVHGWATATLRQEVMYAVIEEREKRRQKVLSSSIPNAERQNRHAEWDAVGWQESVQPMSGNESRPSLGRTWIGFEI